MRIPRSSLVAKMSELKLLQESVVSEAEIDSLGHMNVRFYVLRASQAHFALLEELGIKTGPGQSWRRTDTYNRFHREQFAGANLGVLGGLISVEGSDGISGYYEIRNLDSNDTAATFVITSHVIESETEEIVTIEPPTASQFAAFQVEVPELSRPKTLSLLPPKRVSLEEISALVPEDSKPFSMNGRRRGLVLPEDCGASGRLKEDTDPMSILFRPQPGEDLKNMGPPVQRDEHDRRYSFAMMEIRSLSWHRPVSGDTILSFSADVQYGEKWRHTRRWMFSENSGELLGIGDHAAVCMDLDARRAIPIPARVREDMDRACLPDLA